MKKNIVRRKITANAALDGLHPVLQRIYAGRGIQDKNDLESSLQALLPYHNLLNVERAATFLADMLMQQQRILIVGDFDADGATSCAVAVGALRSMGAQFVEYLVPNRFEFGYGLTPEIVAVAAKWQPNVIITVDNGISSVAGVAAANDRGIHVLITDHHLPASELPAAAVIVNPNQVGDQFASKNLCGVGVIFYVMLALRACLREKNWFVEQNISEPNLAHFLDLVALGTVADVVPLDKNNRILVHQGLRLIRALKCRAGISALLQVAGRDIRSITAGDLGFAVAPRLNAAGRLDDMSLGVACLLCEDHAEAFAMANELNQLNEERKNIEQEMQQQAFAEISKLHLEQQKKLPLGLCLFDETWHQGVIGILAGRVKDYLQRPVIAFAPANEQEIKGSARSIPLLHIRDALELVAVRHPGLIDKFGGHAMAAGLTLQKSRFQQFAKIFNETVIELLHEKEMRNEIFSDGELQPEQFNLELAELLRNAGPWGQQFPEPLFDGRFRLVQQRIVGGKHLKCALQVAGSSQVIDAIAFNVDVDKWPNERAQYVSAAYRLDVNEYRGNKTVQLILECLEEVICETVDTIPM